MNRWQRWKQTSIANKWLVLTGAIVALGTVGQAGIAEFNYWLLKQSAANTDAQIQRIVDSANQIADAADVSNTQQLDAINKSASQSKEALDSAAKLASQQLAAQREALRLDQRAWLGITGYMIQARAGPNTEWQRREPQPGEEFGVRFELTNSGKTPALRVWTEAQVLVERRAQVPPEPKWQGKRNVEGVVVFPNDAGRFQDAPASVRFTSTGDAQYRSGEATIYAWARTYYCDVYSRRHWSQTCAFHKFQANGVTEFGICASDVSDENGEQNHPDCK